MKLRCVFDEYLTRKTTLKKKSADQISYSLDAFEKWKGEEVHVESLTETDLAKWVKSQSGKSAWTVSRNLRNLRTVLTFAEKKLRVEFKVPESDKVVIPRKIPMAWTVAEVGKILEVCRAMQGTMGDKKTSQADWWYALILFLYDSGARITASLSVTREAFDPETRTALLEAAYSKTNCDQIIDLAPDTCAAMSKVISQNPEEGRVFANAWHMRYMLMVFRRIVTTAGIRGGRGASFHRLRRTHATQQVVAHGWESARVALGHSTPQMTARYVDVRQLPRLGMSLPRPGE